MSKTTLKDAINRDISIGDYVFFKQYVYRVIKINKVKLTANRIVKSTVSSSKSIVDPGRCVIINPDDVTYWLLSK